MVDSTTRKDIKKARKQAIDKRQEEKKKKQMRKAEEKQNLLQSLQERGGLWTKPSNIKLNGLSKRQQIEALRIQINAWKRLLEQPSKSELFQYSHNKSHFLLIS